MKILITSKLHINKYKEIEYSLEENWYNFFKSSKVNLIPVGKQEINKEFFKSLKPNGIIFSGGGDISKQSKEKEDFIRDKNELKIFKKCLNNNVPILLVCRGFQLIGVNYSGKLKKFGNHIRKQHKLNILHKSRFINQKNLFVNSFHNYGFDKLPKIFNIISFTKDKNIEIAEFRKKKVLCFMFHPERFCKSQKVLKKILLNFFKK